ncbi:uncharacterized protein SOCEGT47_030270 [Sorangium cellulosum]|uniref:Methyltransferase domain-containing protein n=1 Tax=Sorangium cellulosum TaxID=56 RepID=A0A4P2Q001_SORCE|nr:class I SAM-dependent methyltransferase [Sorangium cellulosum]AUX22524.1 uncharacterized protein SOCEGT47_030270 [Sorangium cellulosum]
MLRLRERRATQAQVVERPGEDSPCKAIPTYQEFPPNDRQLMAATTRAQATPPEERALRRRGAARVVGVDISGEMVSVARAHEAERPLGIDYIVQDVASLGDLDRFDLAVAVHLLGYARSREELVQMGTGIARSVKPGGRFVTYFVSPDVSRAPGHCRKYGVDCFAHEGVKDGDVFYFSLILGDTTTPKLTNHYWTRATVASAFGEAGLTSIRWITPALSPQGVEQHGEDFWQDYLRHLPDILMEFKKPDA